MGMGDRPWSDRAPQAGSKELERDRVENDRPIPYDLDACPRCGYRLEAILWGWTNCPECGLHFECC
jgi:hypothetical protein